MEPIAIGPARVHSKVPAEPTPARDRAREIDCYLGRTEGCKEGGMNLAINLSYKIPIVIINKK